AARLTKNLSVYAYLLSQPEVLQPHISFRTCNTTFRLRTTHQPPILTLTESKTYQFGNFLQAVFPRAALHSNARGDDRFCQSSKSRRPRRRCSAGPRHCRPVESLPRELRTHIRPRLPDCA